MATHKRSTTEVNKNQMNKWTNNISTHSCTITVRLTRMKYRKQMFTPRIILQWNTGRGTLWFVLNEFPLHARTNSLGVIIVFTSLYVVYLRQLTQLTRLNDIITCYKVLPIKKPHFEQMHSWIVAYSLGVRISTQSRTFLRMTENAAFNGESNCQKKMCKEQDDFVWNWYHFDRIQFLCRLTSEFHWSYCLFTHSLSHH